MARPTQNTQLGGPQTREQLGTATGAARIISLNRRGNGKVKSVKSSTEEPARLPDPPQDLMLKLTLNRGTVAAP